MFDPQAIMNQVIAGATSTKLAPVPVGEYPAVIEPGSVEVKQWTSPSKGKEGYKLVMRFSITDPAVLDQIKRSKATVRYEVFLDLDAQGQLDTADGTNLALGRLRVALGLNSGNFKLSDVEGRSCKVRIKHRPDSRDPSNIFDEVEAVAPL